MADGPPPAGGAPAASGNASPGPAAPGRLRRRADFQAAARGGRRAARLGDPPVEAFALQALARGDAGPPRVGFTATKRQGDAPARNRLRRRLREAARLAPPGAFRPGADYVLVLRREALGLPFAALRGALAAALEGLAPRPARPAPATPRPTSAPPPGEDAPRRPRRG